MNAVVATILKWIPQACRWWVVAGLVVGCGGGLALAPQLYAFHYGLRLSERDGRISDLEAHVQALEAELRKGWVHLAQVQGTAKELKEENARLQQKAGEVDALRTRLQEHQQALQQWQAAYQQLHERVGAQQVQSTEPRRLPERLPVDYGDMTFPFGDRSTWITVEPGETSPRSFVVRGSLLKGEVNLTAGTRLPVVHNNRKYYVQVHFDEVPLLSVVAAKQDPQ